MPALHPDTFDKISTTMTPEQAASWLLTQHRGIARNAERDVWDTWEKLVGGAPWQRPQDRVDSYEANFLMAMVRALVGGTEDPKVERADPFGNRRAA